MTRSYLSDERIFQKLRAAGKSSWDENADPDASFDRFILRPFLEESLAAFDRPLAGLSALEFGCGSGPASCFLAACGLTVRGIDVSPTALEMARANAAQRGLTIRFDNADICQLPVEPQRYDLIIDGHCLHCIVAEDHRRAALAAIHRLLKPGGLFLIESMLAHDDLIVKGNYRIDARGVLSIKVDDPTGGSEMDGVDGAFESDGDWFAPHRRLRTAEQLLAELTDAGFTIHAHHARHQSNPNKPMLMRIRAGVGST